MAPHGVPPFGWRDLSTPQSLLTPLSQKTVVMPELLHVFVIVDLCCKLSSSMCRIACPCSCNVSTSSVHVPPVQPLVVSSHFSALLRLLLLVIHVLLIHLILNNWFVALTVNVSVNLMILSTRSHRDRWFQVSLGIAESSRSRWGKDASGHRTHFSTGNSLIHECRTYTSCSRGNHVYRPVS